MAHEGQIEARDVRETPHHIALNRCECIARWHVRDEDVLLWRAPDRLGREDHKEVRFEPCEVHRAQARDDRAHRDALHIPHHRVAKRDPQIRRQIAFEGDREGRIGICGTRFRTCRAVREPLPTRQHFRADDLVTIGRAVFATQRPTGSFPAGVRHQRRNAASIHGIDTHRHDRRALHDLILACAQHRIQRLGLIVLHVEEQQVAGARVSGRLNLSQQIRLHEIDGAEQKCAEAQGQRHRACLVGRSMQVRDPLAQRERPRWTRYTSCGCDEQRRRDPKHSDCAGDRGADDQSIAHVPESRDDDRDQAADQQPIDAQSRDVFPLARHRRRIHLASNRLQRRHAAQRQQWAHREHQGHPDTGAEARQQRLGLENDLHVDRKEIRDDAWQQELNTDAYQGASRGADESHRRRLHDVQRQHLTARRTEASQHGDGIDLRGDEGIHTARDTDAAKQQRDESDDAQEVGETSDRFGEITLGVLDGDDAHARARRRSRQAIARRVRNECGGRLDCTVCRARCGSGARRRRRGGAVWRIVDGRAAGTSLAATCIGGFLQRRCARIDASAQRAREFRCGTFILERRRQSQDHIVLRAAAELEQPGRLDPFVGDVDARTDQRCNGGVTRRVAERARDAKHARAEAQRITDGRVDGDEQGLIDERDRLAVHVTPAVGRYGLDLAVERVACGDGAHLHQTRAA